MEKIINIVVEELKDKNAGFDTIKMCVRIAIKSSNIDFNEKETIYIVSECFNRLSFNPLEDVF